MERHLFKPFKTKRAFEIVSDQIRDSIYSGTFKPGDKLPSERELASQFGTGRIVVREALRTLEQAGLVKIKQGSLGGAFIRDADSMVLTRSFSDMIRIGRVTLQELTEARLGIEKQILDFVIERTNNDHLDLLKNTIENAEQQMLKGKRATEDHINFHILLAKSSKNALFEMFVESIMGVTKSFLLALQPDIEHIKKVLNYHKEIYEAVKQKNVQMAKEVMEEHLLDVNRKLMSLAK